jgi:DeoR/GlpR family transcriptional regulator of sugar metabolism
MTDHETTTSARDRRQAVLEMLLDRESVTVKELTERFGVSTMTVHRDLDALEHRGVLRKVRGGATAQPTGLYESSLTFRRHEMVEEKALIAAVAARRVEPGSSVVLDDSTSAQAMLVHLAEIPQITIVTNFVSIVEEIAGMAEAAPRLIVVGGTYSEKYHSFGGVLVEQALRDLRVDHCFLSVSAIDVRRGAFHQEPDQAVIKRMMIEIADRSTLLADSSKFGKRAMHRVVGLDAFEAVVVGDTTEPSIVSAVRAHGVGVDVAGVENAALVAEERG